MKRTHKRWATALLLSSVVFGSTTTATLASPDFMKQVEKFEKGLEEHQLNPFDDKPLEWYIERSDTFRQLVNDAREALDLPLLEHDERLLFSAKSTADYWFHHHHEEGFISDVSAHTHTEEDSPYFIGKTSHDRMDYYGFAAERASDTTEVVAPGTINSSHGFDVLMGAPYHRMRLLDPQYHSIGVGERLFTEDKYRTTVAHMGRSTEVESEVSTDLIMYPYPEQTDVPLGWDGKEEPNPLRSFNKEKTHVGYPITIQKHMSGGSRLVTEEATLLDEDGEAVEMYQVDSDVEMGSGGQLNHLILIPKEPLAPNTTYTVSVSLMEEQPVFSGEGDSYQEEWSFTTADIATIKEVGIRDQRFLFHSNLGPLDQYRVDVQKEGETSTFHSYNYRNGQMYSHTSREIEEGIYTATMTTDYAEEEETITFKVFLNEAGDLDASVLKADQEEEDNKKDKEEEDKSQDPIEEEPDEKEEEEGNEQEDEQDNEKEEEQDDEQQDPEDEENPVDEEEQEDADEKQEEGAVHIRHIQVENHRFVFDMEMDKDIRDYRIDVYKDNETTMFHGYTMRNGTLYKFATQTIEEGTYRAKVSSGDLLKDTEVEFDVFKDENGRLITSLEKAEDEIEEEEGKGENDEEPKDEHPPTEPPTEDPDEKDNVAPNFPANLNTYLQYPTMTVPKEFQMRVNMVGGNATLDPDSVGTHTVSLYDENKNPMDITVEIENNGRAIYIQGDETLQQGDYTLVLFDDIKTSTGTKVSQGIYVPIQAK